MIRLGILTCTEYKEFDLASQTATTSTEQAELQSGDLCSSLHRQNLTSSHCLVLVGFTDQQEVEMCEGRIGPGVGYFIYLLFIQSRSSKYSLYLSVWFQDWVPKNNYP